MIDPVAAAHGQARGPRGGAGRRPAPVLGEVHRGGRVGASRRQARPHQQQDLPRGLIITITSHR